MGETPDGILRGLLEKLDLRNLRKGRGEEPPVRRGGEEQPPLAVPAEPEEGEGNVRFLPPVREGESPAEYLARCKAMEREGQGGVGEAAGTAAGRRYDALREMRADTAEAARRQPAPAAETTAALENADFLEARDACLRATREAARKNDPQGLESALRTFFERTSVTFDDIHEMEVFLDRQRILVSSDRITLPFVKVPGKGGDSELVLGTKEWQITVSVMMGKENPRRTEVSLSYCVMGEGPVLLRAEVI